MPQVVYTLLVNSAPAASELIDAVQTIEVDVSAEMASVLRITFGISGTDTGDWSILADETFTPLTPLQLRLQVGTGLPEAVINAYVTQALVRYADEPAGSALEVTAMDATMLMNLEEKVKAWPNMSDGLIATMIFAEYSITAMPDSTSPVISQPEGMTLQRGTDIRFLQRLARRNGFECYVQPEPITGLDMGSFGAPRTFSAPSAVLNVNMAEHTNVSNFTVRHRMLRPTRVLAAGIDASNVSSQNAQATSVTENRLGALDTLSQLDRMPTVLLSDTGLMKSGDLRTLAQAVANRSAWAVQAGGLVGEDVGVLRPGTIVNIRGAGAQMSGSYYLTRVSHTIDGNGYAQRFEARRNATGLTGSELFVQL